MEVKGDAKVECMNPGCGRVFEMTRLWQRYCSTKCRMVVANARRAKALRLMAAHTKSGGKA